MRKLFQLKKFCIKIEHDPIVTHVIGASKNIYGMYLNNPKTRNALSKNLIESMKRNIEFVNHPTNNIRAVILMSKLPGFFCAGADLKERASMNEEEIEEFVHTLRSTFYNFSQMKVPSICGIDGFALGGGLELAMSADIRLVTKSSTLGLTECSLGIIPGAGGTQNLPRLVGHSKAKEMIYTAEKVNGQKAVEIGLANQTVDDYKELEGKCLEMAEKIAKMAPLSIFNAKKAIDIGFGQDIKQALQIEGLCYSKIIKSEDRIEGMTAFLEKRPPNFKGK
jgi:methylglutaconyl-CoA hydratase